MLTYGDKSFTWNTGRNLESITDGDNKYSYTYDENGIRTSKTVNGVTTYYNTKDGVILSQTDGTDTLYFQYDSNGTPLGLVWNGTQYFYLTNQMGDVISITDAQGIELIQYEYDAWGKITSVGSTNSYESYDKELANINPLRFRGYYFDNETGYYYLQSRYYDPDICRFINADLPEYAQKQKDDYAGLSLFTYCCNDSVNHIDPTGLLKIKRWALGLGLDTIFTLIIPYFSGPLDVYGRIIQALAKKKNITLVWEKLLYGVVPKFKGLFSKAFTAIRKAIWRVSGSLISNSFSALINANITNFVNLISKSRWNKAWDIISCFFSAGSMVAGIIDYVDGKFNGECRLW